MVKDKRVTTKSLLSVSDEELYEWAKKYIFLSGVEAKAKTKYSATCEMILLEAKRRNKTHLFENAVDVIKAQQMSRSSVHDWAF